VKLLSRKGVLTLCGILTVAIASVGVAHLQRKPYRLLYIKEDFRLSSFHLTRGRNHAIWNGERWQIRLNQVAGSTFLKRWLAPVPGFEMKTPEPALGFIARFKGQISNNELLNLHAEIVTGARTFPLASGSSSIDMKNGSFVKSWTLEVVPPTNSPIEFRVHFGSGRELAGLSIASSVPQFAQPLFSAEATRRKYVEELLKDFLDGRRSSINTLTLLHQISEESGSPTLFAPFEFLFYDLDGKLNTTSRSKVQSPSLSDRLSAEARTFLDESQSEALKI
jgi:hypothetical protein